MIDLTWIQDHWRKAVLLVVVLAMTSVSYQLGGFYALLAQVETDERAVPILVRCISSLESALEVMQQ